MNVNNEKTAEAIVQYSRTGSFARAWDYVAVPKTQGYYVFCHLGTPGFVNRAFETVRRSYAADKSDTAWATCAQRVMSHRSRMGMECVFAADWGPHRVTITLDESPNGTLPSLEDSLFDMLSRIGIETLGACQHDGSGEFCLTMDYTTARRFSQLDEVKCKGKFEEKNFNDHADFKVPESLYNVRTLVDLDWKPDSPMLLSFKRLNKDDKGGNIPTKHGDVSYNTLTMLVYRDEMTVEESDRKVRVVQDVAFAVTCPATGFLIDVV